MLLFFFFFSFFFFPSLAETHSSLYSEQKGLSAVLSMEPSCLVSSLGCCAVHIIPGVFELVWPGVKVVYAQMRNTSCTVLAVKRLLIQTQVSWWISTRGTGGASLMNMPLVKE